MTNKLKIFAFALAAFSAFSAWAQQADENAFVPRDMVECVARGGLPNFYKKCLGGKQDLKVAYLGGSITAQPGWRVQSLDLFRKLFPKASFKEIHAAIGGTGSNFGVCRLGKDVLEGKPDLVFVEFAVNDSGTAPVEIRKNIEGIVRQIWAQDKTTDICFVYTITNGMDKEILKTGKMNRAASVMEEIADYYKIPSINFGKRVAELSGEGKLDMKSSKPVAKGAKADASMKTKAAVDADGKIPFAKDGVHPDSATGHVLYTEAIERSLPAIFAASKKNSGKRVIPQPMRADCVEKVDIIMMDELPSTKGFERSKFGNSDWGRFVKLVPEQEVTFKFKGTRALACVRFGVDGGMMEVTVDGKKREVRCFDQHCSWNRRVFVMLADQLDNKEHTVKIKALSKKFEKRPILTDEHKAKYDQNPKPYEDFFVYISAVFALTDPAGK